VKAFRQKAFASTRCPAIIPAMLSHIVTFYTRPELPNAVEDLIAGCNQYLSKIPGIIHFHVGKMVPSERPVVSQEYQVGLNLIVADKAAEQAYQIHPLHLEFVEKVFKLNCHKAVIFDFS
jgi:Stress responsive A/B Barrel Domain